MKIEAQLFNNLEAKLEHYDNHKYADTLASSASFGIPSSTSSAFLDQSVPLKIDPFGHVTSLKTESVIPPSTVSDSSASYFFQNFQQLINFCFLGRSCSFHGQPHSRRFRKTAEVETSPHRSPPFQPGARGSTDCTAQNWKHWYGLPLFLLLSPMHWLLVFVKGSNEWVKLDLRVFCQR